MKFSLPLLLPALISLWLAPPAQANLPFHFCDNRLGGSQFLRNAGKLRFEGKAIVPPAVDDPKCSPPAAEPRPRNPAPPGPPPIMGEEKWVTTSLEPGKAPVKLAYAVQAAPKPAHPRKTMVYFGGGPLPSLTIPRGSAIPVPDDTDLVVLEYPGMGENRGIPVHDPDQAYSSAAIARYAQAVIAAEALGQIGSSYSLYGISYGSIPATVTASQLSSQKSKLPKPKGVLLEAVIGYAVTLPDTSAQNQETWSEVPPALRAKLAQKDAHLRKLLGGNADGVDQFFRGALTRPDLAPAQRAAWLVAQEDEIVIGCAMAITRNQRDQTRYADHYEGVGRCEQFANAKTPPDSFGGHFPEPTATTCRCSRSLGKGSWDSGKYPIEGIPTFIRTGKDDPVVPPANQAHYAYLNQGCTPRVFCSDEGGVHDFLLHNPKLYCHQQGQSCDACLTAIYGAVFQGDLEAYDTALHGCGPVSCEHASAAPCPQTKEAETGAEDSAEEKAMDGTAR